MSANKSTMSPDLELGEISFSEVELDSDTHSDCNAYEESRTQTPPNDVQQTGIPNAVPRSDNLNTVSFDEACEITKHDGGECKQEINLLMKQNVALRKNHDELRKLTDRMLKTMKDKVNCLELEVGAFRHGQVDNQQLRKDLYSAKQKCSDDERRITKLKALVASAIENSHAWEQEKLAADARALNLESDAENNAHGKLQPQTSNLNLADACEGARVEELALIVQSLKETNSVLENEVVHLQMLGKDLEAQNATFTSELKTNREDQVTRTKEIELLTQSVQHHAKLHEHCEYQLLDAMARVAQLQVLTHENTEKVIEAYIQLQTSYNESQGELRMLKESHAELGQVNMVLGESVLLMNQNEIRYRDTEQRNIRLGSEIDNLQQQFQDHSIAGGAMLEELQEYREQAGHREREVAELREANELLRAESDLLWNEVDCVRDRLTTSQRVCRDTEERLTAVGREWHEAFWTMATRAREADNARLAAEREAFMLEATMYGFSDSDAEGDVYQWGI